MLLFRIIICLKVQHTWPLDSDKYSHKAANWMKYYIILVAKFHDSNTVTQELSE